MVMNRMSLSLNLEGLSFSSSISDREARISSVVLGTSLALRVSRYSLTL